MGGKGGKKKGFRGSQPRVSMTLREEASGRRKHGNVNAKTMCKLDHLKNLAVWSAAEPSIPPLGALFGERLAATNEALGLRPDSSLFVCERCESVLQPGDGCTIRIEKNKSKMRHRHTKPNPTSQNIVVYTCHFCSHRNLMRGTPKGYVKEICPPVTKLKSKLEKAKYVAEKSPSIAKATRSIIEVTTMDTFASPTIDEHILETSCPASLLPTTGFSLLDSKRRKRNKSGAKKVAEQKTSPTAGDAEKSTSHASSKRRKKSWTSLKEIAKSSGHDITNKFAELVVPIFI